VATPAYDQRSSCMPVGTSQLHTLTNARPHDIRSSPSIDNATMTVEGVLFSLAVLHAAGIEHPLRDLVSFFSGRQSGKDNSGFRADRRAAQELEYVESPDAATLRLTPAGRAHLRIRAVHRPPATNRDVHEHILRTLTGDRSRQLFRMLRDGRPRSLEDVARELGYSHARVRSERGVYVCAQAVWPSLSPSHTYAFGFLL
jgi:hypothetical protein